MSAYLSGAVMRGDVPGVVALVVSRNGVLYEGAFGNLDVARGVPMAANTIFRIASMTKPITSVAVLMLVEEGKVRLDDPVVNYLPAFSNTVLTRFNESDGSFDTRPARRVTTVHHLLTHTAGIGYAWSSPVVARLWQDLQKGEVELPRLHEPGERWTYGASTQVLGQLVENVSGRSLDTFFSERIFGPLGMLDTSFAVPFDKYSRVVTIHRRMGGVLVEQPNAATQSAQVRGDGGLYGTAPDYGRFIQAFLNGGTTGSARLLKEATVDMMAENQIGDVFVEQQPAANEGLARPFPLGAGRDKFGLGFQVATGDRANGRSPGSLSWARLNNTHFWIDREKGIGVVLLMQVLPFYDEAAIGVLTGVEGLIYRYLR